MKGGVHFVNPDTPPFVSPQRGYIILDINIQDSAPTDYLLQSNCSGLGNDSNWHCSLPCDPTNLQSQMLDASSKTWATRYHPVYIPMTKWYGKEEYTGFCKRKVVVLCKISI